MSEEKPQNTAQQLLTEILREERKQSELLQVVHWVARFQQIVIIVGLVLGLAYGLLLVLGALYLFRH